MQSFFSYWGGKRKICDWVLSHFPDDYDKMHYCEPFVGSGVLFFAKRPSKWELINDKDKHLMCLFKAVRERPSKLYNLLDNTAYNHNELKYAFDILSGKVKVKDYTIIAWAQFVKCGLSFLGGCEDARTMMCTVGRKSSHIFKKKVNRQHFEAVKRRLKLAHITSNDALWCIKHFDSQDTFFYLDPPYPKTSMGNYAHTYTIDDFNNLTNTLKQIKGKYLISFELKEGMECHNLGDRFLYKKKIIRNSKHGINTVEEGTATECLMSNYRQDEPAQLTLF